MCEKVTWIKNCSCDSTSTTGQIRKSYPESTGFYSARVRYTLYPGPSCDKCGEPWIKPGESKELKEPATPKFPMETDKTGKEWQEGYIGGFNET